MRLKTVYIWTNGNVIAFNEYGNQVPECQGFIFDKRVASNIRRFADEKTEFYFGRWFGVEKMRCNFSWFWSKNVKECDNNDNSI